MVGITNVMSTINLHFNPIVIGNKNATRLFYRGSLKL